MPLLDHFHPPLSLQRHWHAFHNSWATYISSELNRQLPQGYFAEANVQFGIEIDVADFGERNGVAGGTHSPGPPAWLPPQPTLTVPIALVQDIVEIRIFQDEGGPELAGAIELVSPANKDRPAHRDAFVSKCAALIQQGIGLLLVDVVTERPHNLHDALLARLTEQPPKPVQAELYAVSYRPHQEEQREQLDIWQGVLQLGQPLPPLPLCLRGGLCVAVHLEASYERTCQEQRVS